MITYDKRAKRYRNAKGQFISDKSVRREIDRMQVIFKRDARALSAKLENKKITLPEWKKGMQSLIKNNHTVSTSIGKGGWKQMTKSDWGKVGQVIKKEYAYLENFADKIKAGKLSAKQISARASSYSAQLNASYSKFLMDEKAQDNVEAKRTLHAAESCPECVSYAGRWIAIGDMPQIGSLICKSQCRCEMDFR